MRRTLLLLLSMTTGLAAQNASEGAPSQALRLMQEGQYEKAEALLESTSDADPHALRLRLELAERKGHWEEVQLQARRILNLHRSGRLTSSAEIAQAAFAAWKLDRWHDANRLFIEASKLQPVSASMFVDWGRLYLEKYNPAEAESIFTDAIKTGFSSTGYQRWGMDAVYVGMARAFKDQFKPGVTEGLSKAFELNPENLDAIALKVLLALEETDWDAAEEEIEKGLKINANYLPLLELKSALHYFRGETQAFESAREQVLEINPHNGSIFELLGDLSVTKRRLEEAVEFYRESVERNPRQWSALGSLGINLLRLGEEEEGKRALERAYEQDPFNIWTVNTLRLLDSFDRFVRFETPHFRVRLHESEAAALRPYIEELLTRSLAELEQKYNHQISGKYVFEMYPDHEDFAVRTLGLPGLGALGATIGRIVAMDSPSARPAGEFHWGSTLWHELAHVVTLSMSDEKVPRWFSEGLSMLEEREAIAGWGDYLSIGFVQAYESGKLLPLRDLNSGFERPKSPQQLSLSYFQAGWVCEFLASRYGFDRIRSMLLAFAEDLTTEEVFQKVLGASVDEIDEQFQEEMKSTLEPLVEHLRAPKDSSLALILKESKPGAHADIESLRSAWEEYPENYFANLRLGSALKAGGRLREAIPHLEKALEIFPTQAGRESPYELLTEIYKELGESERVIDIRRRWWRMAPRFAENAYNLADLHAKRNEPQEAAEYLEELMYLNPLEAEAHRKLGDLYLQSDQVEKAVREFQVLVAMRPPDIAEAHYKLAEALFRLGEKDSARRHVLLSLETAPSYQEAQKLLLKLVQ